MKPMLRSFAVVAVAIAVVAGCTASSGGLGPVPSPATPSPSASVPPDLTPAPPSTPPVTPGPSTSPAPAPTGQPTDTVVVRAYFFLGDESGSAGLVPVLREVPQTTAVGRAAMEQLLAGPSAREASASPAITSTIPAGSRLLGLTVANGLATVDLSREFESGGGSASMVGRLGQVVFTLTQFSTVREVAFEIEGRPVTVFSGEGIVLDGPVGRDADLFVDQLPLLFVDRPAWGAALGNPGEVSGSAIAFEATFMVTLVDGSGRTLVEEFVMATCGTGCRGTFETALAYDVPSAQWGTLRVWESSARDGEPINVREYPVWLTPR